MLKRLLVVCSILVLCGNMLNAGEAKVFGVTLMSLRHPFFQEMKDEMEVVAKELGVIMRLTDADFDAGKQARQIDDFVQQKVSAILIAPCDSKAVAPALKRATAAGIPVVTLDSRGEGVDVVSHVASDNVEGGRLAAQLMIGALKARNVDSGNILIVDHSGVTSVSMRIEGFQEVLPPAFPNIEIEILNAIGQRDRAMAVTEDALQRFGDELVGIFGINDDCALGALSAVERADMLDQISLVGYDLGVESMAAINDGRMVGDTVQFPGKIGATGVRIAYDYVTGKNTNPSKDTSIEVGTYTKDGFRDQQGNLMK